MSKISTAYDEIITKTSTLFSGKTRIYNPYELTDNPELSLKDSWGVKTLTADKSNQDYCNVTLERNFSLVLTRVLFTTNKPEDFDVATKAMLEDQQSFIEMVYANGAFTVAETYEDSIVSISGIEFIQTDEKKFIFCEVQFKITINELQS
jgi:hypothetical protein